MFVSKMKKPVHCFAIFVFVLLFLFEGIQLCLCLNSKLYCIERERQALLTLKQSFEDPSNRLVSWTGEDCCRWRGVRCDTSTGHVVELDLRASSYLVSYNNLERLSSAEAHSCLAELKHLEHLDLSGNDFNGSRIPDFFGSFIHLRYLNLSRAMFGGMIPHRLGDLTSLQVLDLGTYYYLKTDGLWWVSNLSSLQQLAMSNVGLGNDLDTMYILSKLPSLQDLRLHNCGIKNVHFTRRGSLNSTFLGRLRILDLSANELSGEIPEAFHNMTSLRELDLGFQLSFDFHATKLQWLSSLSSLRHLDMSYVNISEALDLMQVLNTIPHLLLLRLGNCGIRNIHFTHGSRNFTFLERIQSLDIQDNKFIGPIPNALKNMTALTHLDISWNHFNSTLPLFNSKSLVYLYVSGNGFDDIEGGLFSLLSNLCSLNSLDLSFNQFDAEVLRSNMTSLRCSTYDLEILDLGYNRIDGNIPNWFGQLKGLQYLNLDSNSLSGTIPQSLSDLSALKSLSLSDNRLSGSIPQSLSDLSALKSLFLSDNRLSGSIPQSLSDLSALESLSLSNNQLSGTIPQSLGRFPFLESLDLSHNQLNGTIPQSLGSLFRLGSLDLSHNRLNGIIPQSFMGQMVNLYSLGISSNPLAGVMSELHFANLSNLRYLDISSTNLTLKVKSSWIPPFSLYSLNMSFCKIGSQFPQWIRTQTQVHTVDLSNSNIYGDFPIRFDAPYLDYLDLSSNRISGYLADIIYNASNIGTLVLGNNSIKGSMPNSLCQMEFLEILDLSRNKLSGEIPRCWRETQMLMVMELSFNGLSGKLPNSLCFLKYLKRFHASHNSLDGVIPRAMRNCTNLELLDLGENKFSGPVPPWIGDSLSSLRILRLRNNMLNGRIPRQICQLKELQILDLANNKLIGEIPRCFGNLSGMSSAEPLVEGKGVPLAAPSGAVSPAPSGDIDWKREKVTVVTKGSEREYTKLILQLLDVLDLSSNKLRGTIPDELCSLSGLRGLNISNNHLSGRIPNHIGNLKLLETLDLSNNQLSGEIPPSMSDLPTISHLNLSNNHLSGKIPKGNQLQTLIDASIYAGNPQLCGDPLPKKCPGDDVPAKPPTSAEHEDKDGEEDKKEKLWFWFIVTVGFAAGFWGVVGSLVLKRSWRNNYFRFADDVKDRVFVLVSVKMARLKQWIQSRGIQE